MKRQQRKVIADARKDSTTSKWQDKKEKLKLSFPQLTDADLKYDESSVTEMLVGLSNKLGRNVEELQEIMESL